MQIALVSPCRIKRKRHRWRGRASSKRYPGQRYDAASGLNYNYFRDYEAGSGRYVESDPIGLRGGVSTYGYAMQSPMQWIDPKGLAIWNVSDAVEIGAVVGVGGQYANYHLTSECGSNGKRYKITVQAVGPSAGLGLSCKTCFTAPFKIITGGKFNDHSPQPDPNAFNGPYLSVSVGAHLFGFHWSPYGDTLLGRATSVGGSGIAYGMGSVGAELAGTIGTSTVTSVEEEACSCDPK